MASKADKSAKKRAAQSEHAPEDLAEHAGDGEDGSSAGLPALVDRTPTAPMRAERLDAAPEDAVERFAFALWNAGRKEEAIAFLERQREHYRSDAPPLDDELPPREPPHDGEAAAAEGVEWDGPTVSLAPNITISRRDSSLGDIPPPPLPRRPLIIGAALVALGIVFVWPGFDRLAALPGWLGLAASPLEDVAAEKSDAPATTGTTTPVEVVAVSETNDEAEDAADALRPVRVIGTSPDETASEENVATADPLPRASDDETGPADEASVEDVGEADAPVTDASDAAPTDIALAETNAAGDQPRTEEGTTAETVQGSPTPRNAESLQDPKAIDLALNNPPTDEATPPAEDQDLADADDPVTLESLAVAVETGVRLPRPRPEPSAETVAAVTAPDPVRPAVVTARQDDYVIEEPVPYDDAYADYPPYESAPLQAVPSDGPRRLEIIGRVEDRPGLAARRALAERYIQRRRAWAAQREQAPYYSPYPPQPVPYTYQQQPQVPWAHQSWNGGSVPGY